VVSDRLPAVTIGIPFFNAEKTLLDAVRSVFAQTHCDWELILLDDGSTDGSLDIAMSIDDPRVRVYSDGRNKRLATRLNEMARLARFDFLARMDADDLMSKGRIERQLRVLVDDEGLDLVSAGVVSMSDGYAPLGIRCVPVDHAVSTRAVLAGRSGIVHAALLGRRDWFLRNAYDEALKVSQDTNLWIRAYAKGDMKVKVLPEPLYFYREDGNVTSAKLREAYRVLRRTLVADTSTFPVQERLRAYANACMKSMAVSALDSLGRLDILRGRRNDLPLPETFRMQIKQETDAIRALELPIRAGGRVQDGN
jgi:glycosyltransferase involved in cell wall biosynthesis